MNSCPSLHPALVHIPLALIPLAAALRFLGSSPKYLAYLPNATPNSAYTAAHYVTLFALVSLLPTALTGYLDSKKIPEEKKPAKKLVGIHVVLITVVTLITLYNFWTLKGVNGFVPTKVNIYLGLLAVVVLMVSGHIGGKMVYCHGIGVQAQK